MPAWLSDRRSRRGDGAGSNGNGDTHEPNGHRHPLFENARLDELRQHLRICRCSLGGAWAALLDEVESAHQPETFGSEPDPAADRPGEIGLVDAHITIASEGQVSADVWLDVRGHPLHGRGVGATDAGGRQVAVARAALDALRPLVGLDATLESMTLSAGDMETDEAHVVVTVTAAGGRWVGTATAPPTGEESGAALAVLDAIRGRLP